MIRKYGSEEPKNMPLKIVIGKKMKYIHLYRNAGLGCVHPHAIFRPGIKKRYWLYYTPYPPDEVELPYLAISSDGKKFIPIGGHPLISRGPPGSWDNHHLADIEILRHEETWYMYYAGATYEGNTKKVAIGLATSKDGITWSKYKENPVLEPSNKFWWEAGTAKIVSLSCPTVYVDRKGIFHLYYASIASDGVSRIALAVSRDGENFERKDVVLEPEYSWEKWGIDHPHVSILGNHVILLYLAHDKCTRHLGLALATLDSPDKFVKFSKPLLGLKPIIRINSDKCNSNTKLSKYLRFLVRGFIKYGLKWAHVSMPLPLWNRYSLYRASILTYPDKRIAFIDDNTTFLYVSAYGPVSRLPSIGVAKITILASGEGMTNEKT